jgi:hypothetical protein
MPGRIAVGSGNKGDTPRSAHHSELFLKGHPGRLDGTGVAVGRRPHNIPVVAPRASKRRIVDAFVASLESEPTKTSGLENVDDRAQK